MDHQCHCFLSPLAALDAHSKRLEERNIDRHRSKDIRWLAEWRKGLNKISNPVAVVAARSMAVAVEDSSKAVAAARNLAADMLAGGSNNREQLELALLDFGDIFLPENFLHQIRDDHRDMDLHSNKKLQKIKFQQQADSEEFFAQKNYTL